MFSVNLLHVLYNINPNGDVISFKNNFDHDNLGRLDFHGELNVICDLFNVKYGDFAADKVVLFNMAGFRQPKNQLLGYNKAIWEPSSLQGSLKRFFSEQYVRNSVSTHLD